MVTGISASDDVRLCSSNLLRCFVDSSSVDSAASSVACFVSIESHGVLETAPGPQTLPAINGHQPVARVTTT